MSGSGSGIQTKEAMVGPELGVQRPVLQRTSNPLFRRWRLQAKGSREVLRGNGVQHRPTDTGGGRVVERETLQVLTHPTGANCMVW